MVSWLMICLHNSTGPSAADQATALDRVTALDPKQMCLAEGQEAR